MSNEPPLAGDADAVIARLRELRAGDAPSHGGTILSYVYDSGRAELDELAAAAIREVQPVNGLDPTVFTSVAAMERDVITFARNAFHGPGAVGSVTSGGTESCLLAVLSAREYSHADGGSIVVPTTAHAAFTKAAHVLGVEEIRVPVDPVTTAVDPAVVADALREDTFLVVASAPGYPTGALDPIESLGRLARERQIALHVDACLGGFALAWWPDPLPPWDFRVPGVTSLSADLHKYGYTPKGASVLLHADRDRHRAQYFATTDWPGYPVVNPTLLGSRSAAGLAASWAIISFLGTDGFTDLVAATARATAALRDVVAGIDGLRVFGDPVGPVFAVATDPASASPVDPHRWARAVADEGFALQLQPGYVQPDGSSLPATTHLTVTPVTERVVDDLARALVRGAEAARGLPPSPAPEALADLAAAITTGAVSLDDLLSLPSETTAEFLRAAGIDPHGDGELDMPAVVAAVAALPRSVTAKMLTEFLALYTNPL